MAERGSYGLTPRLDIQQLLAEAQHRWLRPAEICEILSNFQKFQISSEPPNRPPSGSLFLFDRKVLRYFRKDGHNWRKKKDGKTVKEAHEKLKVGSIDVLHCYYAHGEDNENFQRRSYWMLEEDLMHIVFVHYLEVKGNRTNVGGNRETDDFRKGSPQTSTSSTSQYKAPSGSNEYTSPSSTLTSLYEDADSGEIHQSSSRFYSGFELPQPQNRNGPDMNRIDVGGPSSNHYEEQSPIHGADYVPHFQEDRLNYNVVGSPNTLGLGSWEEILENCTTGFHTAPSHVSASTGHPAYMGVMHEQQNMMSGKLLVGENADNEELVNSLPIHSSWQVPFGDDSLALPDGLVEQSSKLEPPYTSDMNFPASNMFDPHLHQQEEKLGQNNAQPNIESHYSVASTLENNISTDGNINYAFTLRQQLGDGEDSLKKVDSFSRWVSKELGDVEDLHMPSSRFPWSTVECENVADDSSLSPSLSQDQHFSIIDFSPKWGFIDSQPEVLIVGKFLKNQEEVAKYKWSCMFGEVEVPAEVLADGILCCHAPPHSEGRVPFYVTCSNRVACSEVRDFDYRLGSTKDLDNSDIHYGNTNELLLQLQLESLLTLRAVNPTNFVFVDVTEKRNLIDEIISLRDEEERFQKVDQCYKGLYQNEVKLYLLNKLIKEKLYSWLLHKIIEEGKGTNVLDEEGQGVIHLTVALGYDWAIRPIVRSGVSINFRDINGWTALHWAALYGREQTVALLLSLGAEPGALTDPTPQFPLGRTPADLASANGHKGISGFLAESSLTHQLGRILSLNEKDNNAVESSGNNAVQTISERTATPANYGEVPDALSLKDSLTAVRNATQAADRIHQMYRMQSFEMRKLSECDNDASLDERALSILAARSRKAGPSYGLANSAALQIQKKFRGWKKRKEFLIIRERVVKIQALVRGHQVRKQYKAIVWSVGILEKVILRWRRKGSGLRGFRTDAVVAKDPSAPNMPSKEDDYDFLKEGRKQTEERLQKALTRVKSMVQYPEGRAQYRRVLNVVQGLRETKATDMTIVDSEEPADADDLIEIDKLLDDDTFMSIAFE
ncbi:hypothetical protein UlMin_033812 [Ulmus minor]